MSWHDRDYGQADDGGRGGFGRPGGDWQGVRPSFDNPMSWSVRLGRAFGVDVRVHIIMLLYVVIELFRSLGAADVGDSASLGAYYTAIWLGSLFVLVLLHEFGHVFACRMVGGDANEILMWPLGGLAYCRPPDQWRAHLWTAIGGPLVNVGFLVMFAILLGFSSGATLAVAFPVPFGEFPRLWWNSAAEWQHVVYFAATVNIALLLFNLLPLFPLDGGRIAQSLLWPKFGYVRSMRIAVRVGYIGAVLLGITGFVLGEMILVMVAVFGGITCWMTHKQLEYTEEVMGFQYDEYALKIGREADGEQKPPQPSKREAKQARKRAEAEASEAAELDRLLEKIARDGIESLSTRERRWLEAQSKRKRSEG